MNKRMMTLMASAIAVAATAVPAFSSELEPLRVTVPFAFTAGTKTLPAGDYVVEADSRIVMIRGAHGGAMLLSGAAQETDGDKSGISFERTDKGYLLKEVHSFGRSTSLVHVLPVVEK